MGVDKREELRDHALEKRGLTGVTWELSRTSRYGNGHVIRRDRDGHTFEIDLRFEKDGRMLETYFEDHTPHYLLSTHRRDKKNMCWPSVDLGRTADMDAVVDAIIQWRDDVPAPEPRNGASITASDIARVKAIAKARREPVPATVNDDAIEFGDWSTEQADAVGKVAAIEFPRDDDGRLSLGATLVLAGVPPISTNAQLRTQWLCAVGPAKRRDPQGITVGINWIIPGNQPYRLDSLPSIWDPKLPPASNAEHWGVDWQLSKMEPGKIDEAEIDRLAALCKSGKATAADRAHLATRLQDAGRFGEAFDLYDIDVSEDVWRMASGGKLHAGSDDIMKAWSEATREAFWRTAPWKVAALIADLSLGKKPKYRLFALPNQPQQSKTSLMLTVNVVGKVRRPLFDVEGNGSNNRLAELLWQRPIDLDIQRFGF